MKSVLASILILLNFPTCIGQRSDFNFRNKILIYSYSNVSTGDYTGNSYFIVYSNDSIFRIDAPYHASKSSFREVVDEVPPGTDRYKEKRQKVIADPRPYSNKPYRFTTGDSVFYLNFTKFGKLIRTAYYPLNSQDSLPLVYSVNNLCGEGTIIGGDGFTFFTNNDTTIKVLGSQLHCWGFTTKLVQGGLHGDVSVKTVVYLEKSKMIPVCSFEYYYNDCCFQHLRGSAHISILNKVVSNQTNTIESKWLKSVCN